MMTNYLSCKNIDFQFSREKLLSDISFDLKQSKSLCLVGANGTGKTTLLKIVAGLIRPNSGAVTLFDEEIWPHKNGKFENKCIYLSYKPSFFEELTVIQNFVFYLNCYEMMFKNSFIFEALEHVQLLDKKNSSIKELSSGQKRRLTLAILMLLKPSLIISDEPTNGLDVDGINLCCQIFSELKGTNKTSFLIASHDQIMIKWSDNLLYLSNENKKQRLQTQIKIESFL